LIASNFHVEYPCERNIYFLIVNINTNKSFRLLQILERIK